MKIQLDYDNTIITISDNTNLGEFFNKITKLLPDWEEWKLTSMTYISNWTNVIQPYPYRLWYDGTLTKENTAFEIGNGTVTTENNSKHLYSATGTFNLEV